jgi:SAM-dependent methyltransferase
MLHKLKLKLDAFQQADNRLTWLTDYAKFRYFAYRHRRERPINLAFDRLHNVETADELPLESVGVPQADVARGNSIYRPLTERLFRAAIASIEIDVPRFTFVDIGSGKGKVLFMAADLPFKRIVGIEYAAGLHDVAVRNVATFRSGTQQCRDIQPIHADALEHPLPAGPLVLFIFNALPKELMRQLLERLDAESGARRDRPIILIYTNLRSVKEVGNVFSGLENLQFVRLVRNFVVIANDAPGCPRPDATLAASLDAEMTAPYV